MSTYTLYRTPPIIFAHVCLHRNITCSCMVRLNAVARASDFARLRGAPGHAPGSGKMRNAENRQRLFDDRYTCILNSNNNCSPQRAIDCLQDWSQKWILCLLELIDVFATWSGWELLRTSSLLRTNSYYFICVVYELRVNTDAVGL